MEYIEVPLTKEGPIRIRARMNTYVLDIEVSESEAQELYEKLGLTLRYRETMNKSPWPPGACLGTP